MPNYKFDVVRRSAPLRRAADMATYGTQSGEHFTGIRLRTHQKFKGGFETKKKEPSSGQKRTQLYTPIRRGR